MILAVYPTGAGGARDDFFTAALALMEGDSELGEWLEREQECKAALSEKIAEIEPPNDLRATILAGAQASRSTNSGWRHRRKFLAAAAILVLAAMGSWAWLTPSYAGGEYSAQAFGVEMTTYLSRFFLLGYESEKVRAWLSTNHGVGEFEIPPERARHPSLGCEVIRWHDLSAYLICFVVKGEVVHLFLLPNGSKVEGAPQGSTPKFAAIGSEWATATWIERKDLYLIATLGSKDLLHEVLPL